MKKIVWVLVIALLVITTLFTLTISATEAVRAATFSGTGLYTNVDVPVMLSGFGPGDGDGGSGG